MSGAGERAAKNTLWRAAGEITGKLASLLLFAVMARELGQSGLGVFVFALAFGQIATMPTGLGLDRWLLRHVAADRSRLGELSNVLALKAAMAIPVFAAAFAVIALIGDDARTREAVFLIVPGLLLESMMRSHFAVFNAYERGDLLSGCLVLQRWSAAGLGLLALAADMGVVAVAGGYSAGAAIGLIAAAWLLRRRIGRTGFAPQPRRWPALVGRTTPFAVSDLLGVGLARADAVMLSLIATQAAVGRYGAAYRLLEATFFLASAVNGAFAAMYTYLGPSSDPPLHAVFQRSLKLLLAVLVPIAAGLAILAEPVMRLFFGAGFEAGADTLRLLAPCVVLMGTVYLCTSLIVSRGSPAVMVWIGAAMLALNLTLNAILIPDHADEGAAVAMLITEAVGALVCLVVAMRRAGPVSLPATLGSPFVAGAAAAAAMLALDDAFLAAVAAGAAAYATAFVVLERLIAPDDLAFVRQLVARRFGG